MRILIKISLVSALVFGLGGSYGCTTMGDSGASGPEGIVAAGSGPASAVVIQTGAQDPILSAHKRAFWLDQRESKNLLARMGGSLASGEPEAAIALAKSRLAQVPGDPQALTMLAAALTLTRNYELAAYYAGMLDKVQPGGAFAANIKGLAIMLAPRASVADYRQAMVYFDKALNADGTEVAAGLNLGSLQLELGNATGAATSFQTVVQRCGGCTTGLMGYGKALARSGQYADAAATFRQVLAKQPKHALALYNLALVYKNGYHDKKQAESYLYALINDSRTHDRALLDRAQVVLRDLEGQATNSERTALADKESPATNNQTKPAAAAETNDAELLMTGADTEEQQP